MENIYRKVKRVQLLLLLLIVIRLFSLVCSFVSLLPPSTFWTLTPAFAPCCWCYCCCRSCWCCCCWFFFSFFRFSRIVLVCAPVFGRLVCTIFPMLYLTLCVGRTMSLQINMHVYFGFASYIFFLFGQKQDHSHLSHPPFIWKLLTRAREHEHSANVSGMRSRGIESVALCFVVCWVKLCALFLCVQF